MTYDLISYVEGKETQNFLTFEEMHHQNSIFDRTASHF